MTIKSIMNYIVIDIQLTGLLPLLDTSHEQSQDFNWVNHYDWVKPQLSISITQHENNSITTFKKLQCFKKITNYKAK